MYDTIIVYQLLEGFSEHIIVVVHNLSFIKEYVPVKLETDDQNWRIEINGIFK